MTNNSPPSSAPIKTIRLGDVTASIFAREITTSKGKSFTTHTVSVQRSYVSDGKRGYTSTLEADQLLPAALALQSAFAFIAQQKLSADA